MQPEVANVMIHPNDIAEYIIILIAAFAHRYALSESAAYSYLKQYRLEEAAAALRNSDCPVSEIAEAAGYQSVSKFTDAFKHHFGKTPAAIRRSKAFDHNGIE